MARALGCGLSSGISVVDKSVFLGLPGTRNKSCLLMVSEKKSGWDGRVVACATSAPKTRKPRGIMLPQRISPQLEDLLGVPEISRTQALKLIWAHIKSNNLQVLSATFILAGLDTVATTTVCYLNKTKDPHDRKIIICDEKLKNVFGKDRVGFLEVTKLITPHFLKSQG